MKKDEKKNSAVKKKSAPKKSGAASKKELTADVAIPVEAVTPPVAEEESSYSGLLKNDSFNMIEVLDRFRSRLLVILVMLMIITPVAFFFSDILLYYINKPFLETGNRLNIFTLMGGFMLKFKISVAAAIFVLAPLIIYQIWSIISPSIGKSSRMFSRITVVSAIILFYSGVCFVFFLLLPAAIRVMLGFIGKDMISTIGADNYLGFILFFSISMGVLFEVPVIVLVLTRMGLISPSMLSSKRKYAIVIIWIIAAVITPQPDPMSQAMVGIPLMIIYEISILISKVIARGNRKRIAR